MTAHFTPLGDTARWRVIYELLRGKAIGDVITFEEMAGVLELDPIRHRQALRGAFREAARRYEEEEKRAVDAVRGVGYVIVGPVAQLGLARRHGKKAGRQLQKAYSKSVNVDLSGESPQVRAAFETVASAFAYQMEINRRQAAKAARTERALDDLRAQTQQHSVATDQRLAEIEKRLKAMGVPAMDEEA